MAPTLPGSSAPPPLGYQGGAGPRCGPPGCGAPGCGAPGCGATGCCFRSAGARGVLRDLVGRAGRRAAQLRAQDQALQPTGLECN